MAKPSSDGNVLRILGWILAGVAILAVLVGVVAGAAMALVRRSEPYRIVSALALADEGVRAVAGPDAKVGFLVSGSVETRNDGGGEARLAFPVGGRVGETRVQAELRREAGRWTVHRAVYRDATGGWRSLQGVASPAAATETAPAAPAAPPAGNTEADEHLAAADALYEKKDFRGALAEYDRALAFDPSSAHALHGRGVSAMKVGDDERALQDFRALVRAEPARIENYHLLDQVLTRRQAWDEIIEAWSGLIALQPDNARAYMERGGAHYRKRDLVSARADAEKACGLGDATACDVARRFQGP
jgi:tetratricopeptide (TPR) repeat protein